MIKRIKEVKGLSSPLSFIIIIVLVVVSVTAIVVGGGDGFSRKYAGVDLHEFNARMLLAQTGVLGKILQFEKKNGQYELNLLPIELDGSLLSPGEKYVSSVIPPREGDTPFSYRPEEGIRVVQGYPLLKSYVDKNNLKSFDFGEGSSSGNTGATSVNTLSNNLPNIPGMEICNVGTQSGLFNVFYEDIAYETGVGFDDPQKGEGRQEAVCNALGEFEEMLLLDQYGLRPGIVIQASTEKVPEHALSVVSPQYVGGSGFVSTLLTDYLRTGVRRSTTTFTDTVSVLGINSGFIRFNFDDDIAWTVDSDSEEDAPGYDLETVTRQNMLRLLGFGSFLGHEQENILSSSWKRWTEWDRLLADPSKISLIDETLAFGGNLVNYDNFDPGDAEQYDQKLLSNSDTVKVVGLNIPDVFTIPSAQSKTYSVYTSEKFQKGQSLSGILGEGTASTPIMSENSFWGVSTNEKEVLCFLGLAVDGVAGCSKPRPVAQDVYIERQNNLPVCVNIGQGLYSAVSNPNWTLASGGIVEMTGTLNVGNQEKFRMYSAPCPDATFASKEAQQAFATSNGTTNISQVKSFSWTPTVSMPDMPAGPDAEGPRAHLQFAFSLKDSSTGRVTDQRIVSIHKCEVSIHDNQICNGDFQFGNARSPVDFKIAPLQSFDVGRTPIVSCQSAAMPGWCAQGVQDGFSSEFGYTWHPYLIENPEAYDSGFEWNIGPRKYAGGSSGALVQRLRVPLQKNTTYNVSGQVYVTENGLRPTFWYGSQNTILPQPDGTYHVDYPEVLAGGGEVINEYVLNESLTKGEWHEFNWSFNTGNGDITHIAFGGSNNNGFILYDELSVFMAPTCGECLSDINGDCVTNMDDAIAFLEEFSGSCPNETIGCKGDINFDGVVNNDDLLDFIDRYQGTSCLVEEPQDPYAGLDQEAQVCLAKLNEHLNVPEFSVIPLQDGEAIPSDSQYYAIIGADPESLPWGEITSRQTIILDDCGFYLNSDESDSSKSVWWLLTPPYDPDANGGGGETPSCELDPAICSCIVTAAEFAQNQGLISGPAHTSISTIVFGQDALPPGNGMFLIVGASADDIAWTSGHETLGSIVIEDCGFYVNFEETSENRHVFWLLTPPYEFPEPGSAGPGKNPYEGFSQSVQSCIALFNDNGQANGLFNGMEYDRLISVVYGAHESETFLENQAYVISGTEPGEITWDDLPSGLSSNGEIFERSDPDEDCGFYKDVDGPIWYLLMPPYEAPEEESPYRTCMNIIRNDYEGTMIGSLDNQSCVDEFQSTPETTVVSYGDTIPRGDGTFVILVDETQAADSRLVYTEGYYRYNKSVSSGGNRMIIRFITEMSDGKGGASPKREMAPGGGEEPSGDDLGEGETEEEGEQLSFLRTILASLGLGNGGLFSRNSSNTANQEISSETQNSQASNSRYVFLDGNGVVEGIDVRVIFKDKKEIVPNSNGFKANYFVEIRNTTLRTISGLNIIGILPSLLIYNGHVSTEPNIGYNQTSNTLFIPEIRPSSSSILQRDQTVRVYFNANLNSNTCSQLFNSSSRRTYDTLIEIDLCRDYDLLQRRASESDFVQDLLQLYR